MKKNKIIKVVLAVFIICGMIETLVCSSIGYVANAANGNSNSNSSLVPGKLKKKNGKNVNHGNANGKAWNQKMIQIEDSKSQGKVVKIALIDSGVNFSSDIDVIERKNFIENDECNVLYEDFSGHGTAIAGIIAALDNEEGISGINPKVELYSARVLNDNLEAPIGKIVEAINWAIDKNVDIINLSFGISQNYVELENVIERANKEGILLVAAAGNDGEIVYPAAYDEVMAVGSVDAQGNPSVLYDNGAALEIMAPGENILASGIFEGVNGVSGTSFAAPHVVGAASVLMEMNPEMPADYIRMLLDYSANLYGSPDEYGNGVLDLSYAISVNDKFKKIYNKHISKTKKKVEKDKFWKEIIKEIPENEKAIDIFEELGVVVGMWGSGVHENTIDCSLTTFADWQITILKYACKYPDRQDSGLADMDDTPFHGFLWQRDYYINSQNTRVYSPLYDSNYVMNAIFLSYVAQNYGDVSSVIGNTSLASMNNKMLTNDVSRIQNLITSSRLGNKSWSVVFAEMSEEAFGNPGLNYLSQTNKKLFIYGIIMHMVGDCFSHSTWTSTSSGIVQRIKHNATNQPITGTADDPNKCPQRYQMALKAVKNIISRAYFDYPVTASDFYTQVVDVNNTSNRVYLGNYASYIKKADSVLYANNTYNINKLDLVKCSSSVGFSYDFEGNTPYPEY